MLLVAQPFRPKTETISRLPCRGPAPSIFVLNCSVMSDFILDDISVDHNLHDLMLDVEDISIASSLISNDWNHGNNNNKVSRCIITIFPPSDEPKWLTPATYFEDTSCINIWAGQFEICPTTKKLHAHLYVEFNNTKRPRFNTLRSIIETVTQCNGNIQVPRKASMLQRKCAVNYVLKPDGRAPNTTEFIWKHNITTVAYNKTLRQTKKTKKDSVQECIDWIESKPKHWTWDMILHESAESKSLLATCSWGPKYHNGRHAECERRTIHDVIVFYGAGGTGKTTLAQNLDIQENESIEERYYKRNPDDGKFWGGGRTAYRNQRIIHLEEFCGQETAANFKEICDIGKQGPTVNIKNSGSQLNHEKVIITSNHHPAAWYKKLCKDDQKQWTPLCRRITQVWFFPEHRQDGSLNIPDENNPPYYIDQTEIFKTFIRNYDDALNHAEEVWPLPQETNFNVGFNMI